MQGKHEEFSDRNGEPLVKAKNNSPFAREKTKKQREFSLESMECVFLDCEEKSKR